MTRWVTGIRSSLTRHTRLLLNATRGGRPAPLAPTLSSRAKSRDLLCAFLLPQISTELQDRTRRGTILSAGMAGESLVAAKRLLLRPTFLCPSDAGAHVEICGGRKAHSRSLDCARDDKVSGFHCSCLWVQSPSGNCSGQERTADPSTALGMTRLVDCHCSCLWVQSPSGNCSGQERTADPSTALGMTRLVDSIAVACGFRARQETAPARREQQIPRLRSG